MMNRREDPPRRSLEELFHHRWAVPTIAALHAQGGGAKSITLQKALGASQDSLRRTLGALIESGLVEKNRGYGHPMRPEYLLSSAGRRLGPACRRLLDHLVRFDLDEVGLRKWPLPVIHALSRKGGRFNRIRSALPGATPRAIAIALRDLQDTGLVERFLVDDDPPRTEYTLTRRGRMLVPLLSELVEQM
jgi:DNA-binding HxlR family transcriptional regulator